MITYKRPTTIGQKLMNYKDLALNKTRKHTKGGSRPCEHCALCGCYGKNNKSMIPNVSQLLTKTKTSKLNQSLACADFGIYIVTCMMCHEQHVGQTSNKFSKRWSAHPVAYAKSFMGGVWLRVVWWLFVYGLRCLWRHNLTSFPCFQTNVLAKFVDIIMHIFLHPLPLFHVSLHWI